MKKFYTLIIIYSIVPVGILAILHASIKKYSDVNRLFKRNYINLKLVEESVLDNPGIENIKEFSNRYFAGNYKDISILDIKDFRKTQITPKLNHPIISWYYLKQALFITPANEKSIFQLSKDSLKLVFSRSIPILKNVPVNDSTILYTSYDDQFSNEVYYLHSLNRNKDSYVKSSFPKLNDGGFSTDGEFITTSNSIILLNYNMGRFSVFDKANLIFSNPFTTIDNNLKPPHVIHFSSKGYRIDSKFEIVNLFGFADLQYFYVAANVYSNNDVTNGFDTDYYIIDRYSLKNYKYQNSFRVPKKQIEYGRLINGYIEDNTIILIYNKKIIKANYEKSPTN